jgi:predicted Zn finger-like uncharacterized protein
VRPEIEENGSVIVTCERCATQFQLDDSRVPEDGVRVRCSRCKHAFKVAPSGAPALDVPGPAAADAPDESSDLFAPTPSPGTTSDDEESDWQFNEDPPRAEDTQPPAAPIGTATAASVVDDLLGAASPPPEVAEASVSPEPTPEAPPAMDTDFELDTGRQSFEMDSGEPPASAGIDIGDGPGELGSGLDLASDAEPAVPEDQEAPASPSPAAAQQDPLLDTPLPGADAAGLEDEFDSPAAWDLLGAEDRREEAFGAEASSVPEGLAFELTREDLDGARPAWLGWAARAGDAVGWLGVLAVFAVGLVQGVIGPLQAPSEGPGIASVGGFQVESEGRWVDHLVAGPVYVVSGTVRNDGSRRKRAPALALTLHDAQGRTLGDAPQPVNLARGDRERREDPVDSEGRPLHAAGMLGPGDQRRFEVMVDRLPENVSRFRVVPAARPAPPIAKTRVDEVPSDLPESEAGELAAAETSTGDAAPADAAAVPPNPAPPSRKPVESVPAARAPADPSS